MKTLTATLTQIALVAAASISSITMMQVSTASAQSPSGAFFRAELSSPVEKSSKIIQGVVWQCEGTVCLGAKATSRPINVCTRLSRKMGEVTAFSTRNDEMPAEDIAACNAKG
ncbi:hypothetical protein [Blastomonas sp.]|uniref:CC_3452 family protein n=1 Tax=Blastomonas sp. TaxID=1909299 RepID=UPI0035945175